MSDPTINTAACIALEKSIAAALHYDPASRLAIARLSGKVLALELTQPAMVFYFVPHSQGLNIQAYFEDSVTTRIKGSPLALVGLMNSSRLNLADSGVEVFGNTGLLIELQSILKNLDIDWEQALSEVIGDVLGHETAKGIRAALGWAQQRKNNFKRLLGEYLTEELRALPSRTELNYFLEDVDGLRMATDRVAARIQQLKIQINNSN